MAWQHIHAKFAVVGRGPFPMEMLTVDRCWPDTKHDAALIVDSFVTTEEDEKIRITLRGTYWPSARQWALLGWPVGRVVQIPLESARVRA